MDNLILVFVAYIFVMIFMIFVVFIYFAVISTRTSLYLKRVKYNRWSELASIKKYGFPVQDSFAWLRYVYNDQDNEDANVQEYKNKLRLSFNIFIILLIVLFGSFHVFYWLYRHRVQPL
jgi:hypothetical protein